MNDALKTKSYMITIFCFCFAIVVLVFFITLLFKPEADTEATGRLQYIFYQLWPDIGSTIITSAVAFVALVVPWTIYLCKTNPHMCPKVNLCPSSLRNLQESMEGLSNSKTIRYKEFLIRITSNRLKILAEDSWPNLENGKYNLVTSKGSVTESDLVYSLVSEAILDSSKYSFIKAITTYYYTSWWLTTSGLKYLEGQKNSPVTRIITIPFKLDTFFDVATDETGTYEPSTVDYLIRPPQEILYEMLVVLALNLCLNVDTLFLSPFMMPSSTDDYYLTINCLKKDMAIFGLSSFSYRKRRRIDSNVCAIWADIKSGNVSKTLDPASGNLVFPDHNGLIVMPMNSQDQEVDSLFNTLKSRSVSGTIFASNTSFISLANSILSNILEETCTCANLAQFKQRTRNIDWVNKKSLLEFDRLIPDWLQIAKNCTVIK